VVFRRDRYPNPEERKAFDKAWPGLKRLALLYGIGILIGLLLFWWIQR
jgi:hypothetical protein